MWLRYLIILLVIVVSVSMVRLIVGSEIPLVVGCRESL